MVTLMNRSVEGHDVTRGRFDIQCACTPVVDAQYRTESGLTPADAIIDAVATASGVDPCELSPLYEWVDLDAVDRLVDGHDPGADAERVLGFRIDTWNVFVHADGRIRVCDGTRHTDPSPVFAD